MSEPQVLIANPIRIPVRLIENRLKSSEASKW